MNSHKEDTSLVSRREFCRQVSFFSAVLMTTVSRSHGSAKTIDSSEPPGTWAVPRQNRCLTAIQPLAGRMKSAPTIASEISFHRGHGALTGIASKPGGIIDRAVSIEGGRLRCYRLDGSLVWETHPPGLNFQSLVA